jgi:drug/metabolite transporter (DMT)-like permease
MGTSTFAEAALRRHAILCVLGASACFAVSSGLVKAVSGDIPTMQIVFCRSLFAGMVIAPLLWRHGGLIALATRRPWMHALRSAMGLAGMWCAFYGLGGLPLATNTALGFAMPLILTLLAIPLLGERVGWQRFVVVLAGLGGVLVICRPWASIDAIALVPALVVLAGDVFWAGTMITIRRMGAVGEANVTIVLWFAISGTVVAGLASIPVWVAPSGPQLAALVGIGIVSGLAQMLMTEGYRSGAASVVAPFEYGAIVYTTLMGIVIWGEWPDVYTLAGIAIIVGAGLYLWRTER